MLQDFEWKPEENNGVNESIYTVTPKDLEKEKKGNERERKGGTEIRGRVSQDKLMPKYTKPTQTASLQLHS